MQQQNIDLKIFDLRLKILKVSGVWMSRDSTWVKIFYCVFMQLIFVYIFTLFLGLYIVQVRNLIDFAENMSSFLTYFVCSLKCINICVRIEALEQLFKGLQKCLFDYKMSTQYSSHIDMAHNIIRFYWSAVFATCFIAGFVPFIFNRMAYPMWFPYSLENPFLYYFSAIYQWFGTICYSTVNVSMDIMPVLFMAYYIAMLHHLRDKLGELKRFATVETQKGEERVEKTENSAELVACVDYLRNIVDLAKKTQLIFSAIIFTQGFFSSIILCTTAYALTKLVLPDDIVLFVKFSTYITSMLVQIAIPCYYGTLLSSAYHTVSESLFHSEWMLESRRYRSDVKIFIEYSKTPLKMKAFGIFDIDLQTFVRILNSAYSLFAVFKRVN